MRHLASGDGTGADYRQLPRNYRYGRTKKGAHSPLPHPRLSDTQGNAVTLISDKVNTHIQSHILTAQ